MSEFVYCTRSYDANALQRRLSLNISDLMDERDRPPKRVISALPYRLTGTRDRDNGNRIHAMLPRSSARPIMEMSQAYGSENVVAMAQLFGGARDQLASDPGTALMGASIDAYGRRTEGFVNSVKQYQSSLLLLRDELKAKSPNAAAARTHAQNAFNQMQQNYQYELSQIKQRGGSRGTPLSSFQRGANIAKDSRTVVLKLDTTVEAMNLVGFTRYAKFLGNGLAVVDFGSRIGNIRAAYDGDRDWHRELFRESLSFATSAAAGTIMVGTGAATVGLVLALTPVGWAGIIVVLGTAAVIAAGAATAYSVNNIAKNNSDWIFDKSQDFLSR
jgi:hypothetical protein